MESFSLIRLTLVNTTQEEEEEEEEEEAAAAAKIVEPLLG